MFLHISGHLKYLSIYSFVGSGEIANCGKERLVGLESLMVIALCRSMFYGEGSEISNRTKIEALQFEQRSNLFRRSIIEYQQ